MIVHAIFPVLYLARGMMRIRTPSYIYIIIVRPSFRKCTPFLNSEYNFQFYRRVIINLQQYRVRRNPRAQRCSVYYGAPFWTIFGDELSVRCWIVGAMFPPSIFEDRCSKIDGRCEDRWSKIDDRSVDLQRSIQ